MSWDPSPPIEYAFPPPLTHECDVCHRKGPAPHNPKRPWCNPDADQCDGNMLPRKVKQ